MLANYFFVAIMTLSSIFFHIRSI